ncbi:unnamed protein product [Mytilus edulis]|uniref:Uncharacterized protein n=1 Tax=Mytilus edulis TaxID=6550 RepID=A0A8S3S947_MYTED|nr:unnamed protein product [Mytilus edulis]
MLRVSKIPSDATEDALTFFFENTRKSGGGDVEEVDYDEENHTAIVTFEEDDDALDDSHPDIKEAEGDGNYFAIHVSGFDTEKVPAETLKLYFESRRGADVDVISLEKVEENAYILKFEEEEELRKRMNALEKNVKQLTCSNQMSYALATSKPVPTDLTTNTEINVDMSNENNETDSSLLRDSIVKPVYVNHPKKNVEKGFLHKKSFASVIASSNITPDSVENVLNKDQPLENTNNSQHKIPVHFPSSVCSTFKGVVHKKKVSRFYVGGIDKRNGSEKLMRKYLEDRNVKVTFIRYFDRHNKRTASAQLNVISDDEPYICDPYFWPSGIFTKPWLSWQQFVSEHSISSYRRNGI